MLARLKDWLSSLRRPKPTQPIRNSPERGADPLERWASRPMSLDAQLAVANGRMTEGQVMQAVREGLRRFRETASNNPASAWALSFVDPYDWAMDTPDFYPGFGALGGWGVPWMLNNQGVGDVLPVYINEYGLKLIRDWSRKILQFNEFALNAVENRISYIVGKGFQYTVLPKKKADATQALGSESGGETDQLAAKAQAVLDEFVSRERWNEREQECVKRCDRDGEAILRFFHVGGGRTSVRFVEPECLTDGKGRTGTKYGILTEPGDVEKPIGYSIVENPNGDWTTSIVPPEQILHIKLNTDFDAKRGLPTLFPVRKNLERADKLLRNMSVMAQVQATFAVIRKHKQFAPSAVSAYQQNQTDLATTNLVSGRTLSLQQYYPGSVIDTSDKTEYEFPSAGVDASGLVVILDAELRAIAARMVMTDWMLTANSQGANVSTALVAGAPCVEKFKRDQAFFARRFGDGEYGRPEAGGGLVVGALWRVLAIAVDAGLLPPETLTNLVIQAEGPSITVVNKVAETNRAKNLFESGILSAETWAKWEGLDYQQEVALGAKPKAPAPAAGIMGAGVPPTPSPPGSKPAGGVFESLAEEIKMVFGKCIDTSTHKQVPCPAKDDAAHKKGQQGVNKEVDPDANRPSSPENRHPHEKPKALEWRDPPPKKGKKGGGAIMRPKGDKSQTKLGDQAEDLAETIGFRDILPAGQRSNKDVATEGSSIDLEYDHSGRAYELKMCQTTATEYRLKAKKEEKDAKMEFAKMHDLEAYVLIGVRDGDAGEIHFYAAKEPGMTGAEVSQKNFDYVGTVKF